MATRGRGSAELAGQLTHPQRVALGLVTSLTGCAERRALALLQRARWDANAAVDLFFSAPQPPRTAASSSAASSLASSRRPPPRPSSATAPRSASAATPGARVKTRRSASSAGPSAAAPPSATSFGAFPAASPASPILLDDSSEGEEAGAQQTQERAAAAGAESPLAAGENARPRDRQRPRDCESQPQAAPGACSRRSEHDAQAQGRKRVLTETKGRPADGVEDYDGALKIRRTESPPNARGVRQPAPASSSTPAASAESSVSPLQADSSPAAAEKRALLLVDPLQRAQSRKREERATEAEQVFKILQQKYAWRHREIERHKNPLSTSGVKGSWTAYLGCLTLDSTVMTAAFTRPPATPQMHLVADMRVQLPSSGGTFFAQRRAPPTLYRVDPQDRELREEARALLEGASSQKGGKVLSRAPAEKKRPLPPLATLLSNLTDASCTLRLLLGDREAGRMQKDLTKEILLLLLLDVIKVHLTWLPSAPPVFPLRVGVTVSVAVHVCLTSNLFRLEKAKNCVDLDLGGQSSHALARLFRAVGAPMKNQADLLPAGVAGDGGWGLGLVPMPSPASLPSLASFSGVRGRLTAHRVQEGAGGVGNSEGERARNREEDGERREGREPQEGDDDEDERLSESEDEGALDAGNRLSDFVFGTDAVPPAAPLPPPAAARPSALCAWPSSLAQASALRSGGRGPRGRLCPSPRVFRTTLRRYQEEGLQWLVAREADDFELLTKKRAENAKGGADADQLTFLPPSWFRLELPAAVPASLRASSPCPSRASEEDAGWSWVRGDGRDADSSAAGWKGCANTLKYLFCNFDVCAFSLTCPTSSMSVKGGILGDAMGLGKTIQLLALVSTDLLAPYDPQLPLASDGAGSDAGDDAAGSRAPAAAGGAGGGGTEGVRGDSGGKDEGRRGARASLDAGKGGQTATREGPERDVSRGLSPERDRSAGGVVRAPPAPRPPRPEAIAQHLKPDQEGFYPGGTLVVVPLSLLSQWREEILAHMQPGVCSFYEYYGAGRNKSPAFLASHTLVITTYQTLATDFRQAAQGGAAALKATGLGAASPLHAVFFYRVVLDEGHLIKSAPSSQSQACCALHAERRQADLQRARNCACTRVSALPHSGELHVAELWMLTGTPLQNDVSDAFALVKFLKILPMGTAAWWNAHVAHPMERGQTSAAISTVRSILFPLMLRRHANSKGEDGKPILPLPPISFHCFNVCLTPFERELYMAFFTRSREEFERLLKAGVVMTNYSHVLLLLLRLRQLCCHPSLVTARSRDLQERILSGTPEDVDRLLGALFRRKDGDADGMAPSSFMSSVVQDVREGRVEDCPVCLDFPAEPVLLASCCHTLCHACALNMLRRKQNECPVCRRRFERSHVKLLPAPARLGVANGAATGPGASPPGEGLGDAGASEKCEEFFFSTKLKVAVALVAEDVRRGRSAVVFSQWTSMLDTIERGFAEYEKQRRPHAGAQAGRPLLPYKRLDGSMTSAQRQAVLAWFAHSKRGPHDPAAWRRTDQGEDHTPQGDACDSEGPFAGVFRDLREQGKGAGEAPADRWQEADVGDSPMDSDTDAENGRILLCSLKAGNVGLNLTRASRCYLMDGWWNPQVENQAMKRIWRFGQEKPVKVIRFVCVRTVEERLEEIKEFKGWMARGVCETGLGVDEVDEQGVRSAGRPESFDEDKRRGRLSIEELKRLFRGFETEEVTGTETHDNRRYPGPALQQGLGTAEDNGESDAVATRGSASTTTPLKRPQAPHTTHVESAGGFGDPQAGLKGSVAAETLLSGADSAESVAVSSDTK
ncbi:hypothetical protein BESB_044820 [Besnoitia besnoiti]|uniref:SWI2/SNF2-containing protein RAD5 n=1 Tax=Besnoitia besnoiti TaxID=94643 RepID=A0A2A9MLF3_BESBE|nr:hypothetical protein BESB_044820 [Besnoitia besnoiti]PFH36290.1 hypothetical protein BESB_044820 [Besnoitia besnoiti]